MARNITYREALNEALAQEMERDESVIVMGEDNAGGAGAPGEDDAWGLRKSYPLRKRRMNSAHCSYPTRKSPPRNRGV